MSNQSNTVICAGDQIRALKRFSDGCLFARVVDGKTLILSGINLGASIVTVERVIEGDCDEKYYLPMQTSVGCALLVTSATPMQPIKVAGYYRLCISPANPDALLGQEYVDSDSAACCSINAQCQPATVLSAVTEAVTGLPCPLPATFMYNGAQTTLSAFIADIKAQVTGATWTGCGFSAPAPAAFPPLVVSAVPVPVPVYCPSQPLLDGGFGYHIADPKDPAATVEIAPCAGDTSTDSIWVYPTAGAGHTAKVVSCDGTLIGYGANQSNCAVTCPCPDMNVTVNNAAPVNNVNVAAPNVSIAPAVNNFAPSTSVAAPAVTNNFAPTTNVAAPNVVMPPAPVTGLTIGQTGAITLVSTNAAGQQTIITSNDLPSC